jgi:molecular chaperone GrpE
MSADPNAPNDDIGQVPGDGDAPLDVAVEVDTPSLPHMAPVDEASDADPVKDLETKLAKAEQEKKDNWDKFLRAAADLENHRRRSKRDLDDARAEAKQRVLKEMLPVVDNLERAVQHAEEAVKGADLSAIVEGVRLVLRQFGHALERADVTPVDAQGQPFDPNLHEAISQQETADQPPGTVVNVLQRGYKLGDRLLRPALVVVAKQPSAPSEPST